MHDSLKRFLLTGMLLAIVFVAKAQDRYTFTYNDTPLAQVLQDVEARSDLLFSYSETVIAEYRITLSKELTINGLLAYLQSDTGLLFEPIRTNQIIISPPDTRSTVCGYVFDAIDKTPLAFATILIKGTTKGYTTDARGYFSIVDEPIETGILLQFVGYATRLLMPSDFADQECLNFLMEPQIESLKEVVVRSYLIKGIDKNKDGSLTLQPAEQGALPGLVESDVFQSAQWVPGISSINETVSDIQIRGGSADQNLILYDGIKMYNTGHFFGMLSIFNPNITTRATLSKSGASAAYGERISGVIDIEGETQIPETLNFGLGLNGTQADTYLKTPLGDKLGLVVSGRRSYADIEGLGTPTFEAISEKVFQNTIIVNDGNGQVIPAEEDEETLVEGEEVFSFYDLNLKLIVKPSDNDSIYVSGLLTDNDLNFVLVDDENRSQDALSTENQGLSFDWTGRKGRDWHHSLSAYYSNFDSQYRNRFFEDNAVTEENLRRNSVKDYGLRAGLGYDLDEKQQLELGYQLTRNEVAYQLFRDELGDEDIEPEDPEDGEASADERDFNEASNFKNTTHALYANYDFRPKNRGLVRLGLRGSRFSLLDAWYFEPRLNIEYPLSKNLRIKLTAERRFQIVSQLIEFEDTRLRLQSGIWTLTEENIPVLESTQFSTGFLYDIGGWTLDVDAYFKNIDGLTSFTNGFTNASEEYSQGESEIFGVDVLLKKQWQAYRIWLGYTFNEVRYRFEELAAGQFPGNNDITHNLTLSNTYELDAWRFSLGWNFRSGAPFTPVTGFDAMNGDIDFAPINSARLPDYHRLDASIQYRFAFNATGNTKGVLGVSAQNLYARQVPLSVFYRVDENPETGLQEIDQLEQLSLGFTPNFLFRVSF
ncbi:TonB-dependent receptor [Flagellimonas sp. DF-77]|uniref:TonB-dependent receptor n=1 Tax=Flagellimonas algarum TaxID=3230298 RepID=UPI0033965F26